MIKLPTAHCRKSAASAPYAALASAARRKVIVCCSVTGALNEQHITAEVESEMTPASRGATPVLLAVDGQAAALFAIRDPLREDSVDAWRVASAGLPAGDATGITHREGYRQSRH